LLGAAPVFTTLTEHIPDLVYRYRLRPTPGFEYVSPAATALVGYTPQDHYDGPDLFRRIVVPEDRHLLEHVVARLAGGAVALEPFAIRWRHKNGSIVWTEQHIVSVRDDAGEVVAIEGLARDVTNLTDRRLAERAIERSEQQFRRLIENATDLIATVGVDGTFAYATPSFERILGYPPAELVGRNAFDLLHPDDADRVRQLFDEAVTGETPRHAEYRYRHKDGSWRWLESRGHALRDDDGAVVGAIINSRDVTEQHAAARALENANALRKAIEDSVMAGLVILDEANRISYANPAFCSMTGFYERELVGAGPPLPFWPPEESEVLAAWLRQLVSGETPPEGREVRFMRRQGDRFDVFVLPSPLQLPDGTRGWLSAVYDITDRKRLESEFRQAQKMEAIGRLAGGVAHDFNNLLTAILGYSELALDATAIGDPLRDDLAEIRKAGESAASLTRQLLAFSRHQVLQPSVLDLNTVVTDMSKILARVIGEDVALVIALAPDLRPTRADRGQIEQVIMNLAVNARDAMPSGGSLAVQTANRTIDDPYAAGLPELEPGDYVVLAVSDTGCGMDDFVQAHLFEPFFTTKDRGRGTGLGLATIYGIVKQSAGHIMVRTRQGKGTSFIVFLPVTSTATHDGASVPDAPPDRQHGETVLVVEDNDAIRALAQQVLRQAGYRVHVARTGEEAIGMVEMLDARVDLLLTDVVMPGISGPALAARLRERSPGLRCVLMSGYTDDALAQHGVESLDVFFLQKPFKPAALLQIARERLEQESRQ